MIIPSIDIKDGEAVQMVEGKEVALEAGDPAPIARRYRRAGEIAVIDLDAALGEGSNREIITDLVREHPCRVGGGIRDMERAEYWLAAGAEKIIIGTAADPEFLKQLPEDRVVVALDAEHGEVVVEGWKTRTGRRVVERLEELREYAGEFMVTFVEREGHMDGTDLDRVEDLVEAAGKSALTVAGGITSAEEIRLLDEQGVDAQVGMALYTDTLHLADAIAAPLNSDREDGLWPTVVCDERGIALGLAYSNLESLREAVETGRGVYHSRSRGLWKKGETSGAVQHLHRIDLDCDRDALRFQVQQEEPGFCHKKTRTCWGEDRGLFQLIQTIKQRMVDPPEDSYTKTLLDDPRKLREKLEEEVHELMDTEGGAEAIHEVSDVVYFLLVAMAERGIELSEVEEELYRRSLEK